jgi:hypothetical protein
MSISREGVVQGVIDIRHDQRIVQQARAALAGAVSPMGAEDAIEVLAASAFPNRHRDLEKILMDPEASSRTRMRAAIALGRADRAGANDILAAAVRLDDPIVQSGVLRALGMIGEPHVLKTIDHVMPGLNARARALAEFARLLIVHRHGLSDATRISHPAGKSLEPATDCGRRLQIRPARPQVVERSLTGIGSLPYGIELDERSILEYRCDRSGAILLNRAFAGRDGLELIRSRPAIVGVEARRDKVSGRYSVATLILTTPRGDDIDIAVYLTNGTLVFKGRAELRDGEAHWKISAIERPGAFPFRASGRFVGGVLHLETADSGTRIARKLRPAALDISALR